MHELQRRSLLSATSINIDMHGRLGFDPNCRKGLVA